MAASRNHISKSAVSQQLSFLERHFGRKLVERGPGRFSLTEAGESLLEACRKIEDALQEAGDRINLPGELSGTVHIETVYSIGLHSLGPFVKSFMKKNPSVNLHVEYERADRIVAHVVQGSCDLGIVAHPAPHPLLRVIPFMKERLSVALSPSDPLASRRSLRLSDLHHKDFVAFEKDIPTRRAVDEALRERKVAVNIVQEFGNIETIKRAVETGMGAAILPENTLVGEVRGKSLVSVPVAGKPLWRPTGILLRKDRATPRAVRAFAGWLLR